MSNLEITGLIALYLFSAIVMLWVLTSEGRTQRANAEKKEARRPRCDYCGMKLGRKDENCEACGAPVSWLKWTFWQ